jgi:rare lipoprotein A
MSAELARAADVIASVRSVAWPVVAALAVTLGSSACAGRRPAPGSAPPTIVSEQDGFATFVARSFHGRTAANGEAFDERRLVAAHRTLPFGSVVRVTNVRNGRSVTVRIVDRGPYGKNYREGTIIDLSRAAARRLRMIEDGQIPARVEVLTLGEAK